MYTHVHNISVDLCMQRHNADFATHRDMCWWRQRVFSAVDRRARPTQSHGTTITEDLALSALLTIHKDFQA